ncbi:hypothetical protein BXT86_02940 [candidate division WOR-3 bacterium 4484_100]|uniref:non-specific protein-tyrosine kinase n=1 Tax=candidate division WOR-3 bacterium 4484_100 TaxID=1936077 RepID=A0A1V4QH99_UNCW3|nr:MAG: hypothetical protein BXT86_02940 [candidate division WOR-3 bacterium 4484_100]
MKSEPTLQDYFNIIMERRRLIIICVAVTTVVALIASFVLPKVYEARVKFKLDLSESKPMFFSEIYTPQTVDPVESQLEIVRSRTIAKSVIKKLGLNFIPANENYSYFDSISVSEKFPPGKYYLKFNDNNFVFLDKDGNEIGQGQVGRLFKKGSIQFRVKTKPKDILEVKIMDMEKRVDKLLSNISANQIKNTALVLLKARSRNPYLAALIANTLAREYINYCLQVVRESARGSKEFIESQIRIFGDELNRAEEELRKYKEKSGIFLLQESAKEIIKSLADFETQKEKALVELHEVESSIKNLETELSKDEAAYGAYKRMASFPTLSRSPIILSLKKKLKSLQLQKQELLSRGEKGEKLIRVEADIQATEQELSKATHQIALAGPSINDPIFQSIISNIINKETKKIALQSSIDALNQIISRQNRRLKQLPEAEVNLAQLERKKLANEEIYTMLMGKLEESKIAEAMQISEARIIDSATPPKNPMAPKKKQNTILGFFLGLIIGIGGAFLLEYFDTSLKSTKEVEELTGLSVLATIPLVKNRNQHIPTIHEPYSQIAEAYRILRTNLAFTAATKPLKSLLITSTLPQEGKTTTCINLGITFAQQGHKVILLDCDFRRPMLHTYFGELAKDNHHGLSDVLIRKLKLNEAIRKGTLGNLFFVTSGTIPSNPSELLGSPRMREVLQELKKQYEFILIDAPPSLGVADARVLGKICDGIIVVVMARRTSRDAVIEIKEELERAGDKIVGFVLNGVDFEGHYYRHRYYYYHYPSVKK